MELNEVHDHGCVSMFVGVGVVCMRGGGVFRGCIRI